MGLGSQRLELLWNIFGYSGSGHILDSRLMVDEADRTQTGFAEEETTQVS